MEEKLGKAVAKYQADIQHRQQYGMPRAICPGCRELHWTDKVGAVVFLLMIFLIFLSYLAQLLLWLIH